MEILGYYGEAEIMIESNNGIVTDCYIWMEDTDTFIETVFEEGLNPLFIHVVNPMIFLQKIGKDINIPQEDCDNYTDYDREVDALRDTIRKYVSYMQK